MTDLHQLQQLVHAYEQVGRATMSYDEAAEAFSRGCALRDWLYAEERWHQQMASWFEAESRWKLTRHLIANDPSYASAEQGWLRMKELAPNLDGVDDFTRLSPILQARYAVFAEGVLLAWKGSRVSPEAHDCGFSHPPGRPCSANPTGEEAPVDDDGQVCDGCPGGPTCCFQIHAEDSYDDEHVDYYCEQCHDYH